MNGHIYLLDQQPSEFPTHRHNPEHWEWLGRAVGTFGFLEEVLRRAIFVLTGTKSYESDDDVKNAYENWIATLERALVAELGTLIPMFEKSVKEHHNCKVGKFAELLEELNKVKDMRNLLCHASWQVPNDEGKALPQFVRSKDKQVNLTRMDAQYLRNVQLGTANLCCMVMSVVTSMGLQFPGSNGPGNPVW